MHPIIAQDTPIMAGQPRLAGTGVTVRRLAAWHALGLEVNTIAQLLGHVTPDQVEAALAYAADHAADLEAADHAEAAAWADLPAVSGEPATATVPAPRLYTDEDSLWHPLWKILHAAHLDHMTALAVNLIEVPTAEHLGYASLQGRLLLTFNAREYQALHDSLRAQNLPHAGVIVLRPRLTNLERLGQQLGGLSTTQLADGLWRLDAADET